MAVANIEREFQAKVHSGVRLLQEGLDRYLVFTPFEFGDGDHLVIVLRREGDGWTLTDEGHTLMHLTYHSTIDDFFTPAVEEQIARALSASSVENRAGVLALLVPDEQYGDALFSFVEALLRLVSIAALASGERTREAFLESFRVLLTQWLPADRASFLWHDPTRDPRGQHIVDCLVRSAEGRPLLAVYALTDSKSVERATSTQRALEQWGVRVHSVGVFENEEVVDRKALARFSDLCGKLFSNFDENRDRVRRYLVDAIAHEECLQALSA